QQRLEQVVVAAVDQRDADVVACQRAGRPQPGETATDNNHVVLPAVAVHADSLRSRRPSLTAASTADQRPRPPAARGCGRLNPSPSKGTAMTASDPAKRIALLIDADNAPAAKIDVILAEVARHGEANVRRAYGNWKNPHIKGWEEKLHAHAIQPIQQFAYSTGKNASDMAMVIDGMDLLYARNLDGFAIVSSDADFTPLVMRLRSESLKV